MMINPATIPKPPKPVDHIEALKTLMDKRAFTPLTEEDRARLDGVIATYQRLYVVSA